MKVVKNYLYNVGYQVLAIIVPLITSAYVSRVLRPEGVGANSFTNSIIQYFICSQIWELDIMEIDK